MEDRRVPLRCLVSGCHYVTRDPDELGAHGKSAHGSATVKVLCAWPGCGRAVVTARFEQHMHAHIQARRVREEHLRLHANAEDAAPTPSLSPSAACPPHAPASLFHNASPPAPSPSPSTSTSECDAEHGISCTPCRPSEDVWARLRQSRLFLPPPVPSLDALRVAPSSSSRASPPAPRPSPLSAPPQVQR